ncbi:hypothetical protein Tco_0388292 [Tanacetum coccineum]
MLKNWLLRRRVMLEVKNLNLLPSGNNKVVLIPDLNQLADDEKDIVSEGNVGIELKDGNVNGRTTRWRRFSREDKNKFAYFSSRMRERFKNAARKNATRFAYFSHQHEEEGLDIDDDEDEPEPP